MDNRLAMDDPLAGVPDSVGGPGLLDRLAGSPWLWVHDEVPVAHRYVVHGKLEHPAGQARAPDFETEAVEAEHELEVAGQMGLIHAALVAVPDRSVDGGPSPTTTPDAWDRARIETVPVFTYNSLDEGGAQLCPCGIATITPQHFTVASRASIHMPTRKFPISTNGRNECAPHPAHIHQHGVSI